MAERVGQSFGNYQLLRLLGQGAFAEVYLAEHRFLEIPAAIKVLRVRMEPDTHEQFRREARTIAHLQHPHIVQVLDFGLDDQTPYLVMEYMPGGTLRSHHPKGTQLPFEQIVTYVKQIASALDYAHQRHLIHRDVKPENLLLNARHHVVLSDFGLAAIAHSTGSLSTSAQRTGGTIAYMAPEQIEGHPRTASDQYALGVMVYEWLCGQRPFEGSLTEVMVQHLSMPPPPLHERVPTISPTVEQAVLRALAKDPHQRFSSVQDFATVLEEAYGATQPLVSHVPLEREGWAQLAPPVVPAAMASEVDRSSELTPSRLLPAQRTGDENEPLQGVGARPVVQSPTVLKHTRPSGAQSNRQRFLRKVRAFWITGVLEHSLHGAALLALGLEEQPDAVANPWQLVLQHPAGASRSLPAGTRITQVYDAAEGELLILGAPGSGKSTLLLELARDLLNRAEYDERHPLPALFNLSSWVSKQQPLADWLVEELSSSYQVPRKLGQAWVEADQILPLLDGLDEVAPQDRTACIESINSYRGEHGLLPLVVCSRSADYLARTARVQLGSAVAVQPLTQQQVDDYLASGGEPLWALRAALHRDEALRELTNSPLMLSILTLTYHGMPFEELLRGASLTDWQRQIFDHYVERMLRQRGAKKRYTAEQTTHWLTWLACQMTRHNQSQFYLERLQPDWLSEPELLHSYGRVVRLAIGIVSGIIILLCIGIAITLFIGSGLGLWRGLTSGLVGGLSSGFIGGLAIAVTSSIETEIHPAEAINWSWKKILAVSSLKSKLKVGISSSLLIALIVDVVLNVPDIDVTFLLAILLLTALLITIALIAASGLTSGISSSMQDERDFTSPNQGIRRSARNGLLVGIIGGLIGGISSVVAFGLILILAGAEFSSGLVGLLSFLLLWGALGGTVSGLVVGLSNGGIACIQHLTLRFQLWRSRCMPWNYPSFLNYTVERILLRKLGGSYIFIHQLLLDYFASLGGAPSLKKEVE